MSEVNAPLRRLLVAALAGIAAVILALLLAIWLARTITRPVSRLAAAARAVGALEVANVPALPRSPFREIDDQASAFNAMLHGLKWFEIYVPRSLVRRLIRQGDPERVAFQERAVTVMFTDIAGFTTLAEGRSAADVAGILNEHFSILAAAVEREGGNVGAPGRMNYTIVGNTVNVAQRLEQLCKDIDPDDDATVLASASTVAAAGAVEDFVSAGRHAIKGRVEPVDIYRLSPRRG